MSSSSPVRCLLRNPRPLRALVSTRCGYATISTKNPHPTAPIDRSREQAQPMGRFYEAILNTPQPIPEVKPEEPATPKATAQEAASKSLVSSSTTRPPPPVETTASSLSPVVPTPPPTATSTEDKAKVIFGSRLAGPTERAERLAQIRAQSTTVAGVLVPPKPQEPDNCCMSGCVNCVWDLYRDEMEEWALANAEAEARLAAEKTGSAAAPSMDDDGGGSETNWNAGATALAPEVGDKIARDFWDDNLYKNVPVGIREFMKQEKRLKEKHLRQGTLGG
ncbi:oxidoreductase-like protein [Coniella lustricola]|uniref:Oxidoreductase-like protein n=1 Tax=Coniella lustricola TaxID=2025994 RepID=A0A2T2ZYF7_9PEZI|nr:oxidoreductase-like protein [Coniella lustricola]